MAEDQASIAEAVRVETLSELEAASEIFAPLPPSGRHDPDA
jgi:hypothetical protein